jgi:hypothetical protein
MSVAVAATDHSEALRLGPLFPYVEKLRAEAELARP